MKRIWELTRDTFNEFIQDRVLRLAAATAYYAVFSIGPLLVLVVAVAGLAFGPQRVRTEVTKEVQSYVGEKSARVIDSMMSAQHESGNILATIIGGGALLIGAAGIFGQMQDSLNAIWGVTTKPGASIWAFLRDRFFSMAMILGIGFLLLISMVLTAMVDSFAGYLGNMMSVPKWVLPTVNDLISLFVVSLLFGLIFKVLPDVRLRWRHVWLGAVLTALLFTLGKFGLGIYLSHEINSSSYGAGSAFVVILLYVYYSSVILYLGAAFTKVYSMRRGIKVRPARYAIHMSPADWIMQGMPRDEHVEAMARRMNEPEPAAGSSEAVPAGAGGGESPGGEAQATTTTHSHHGHAKRSPRRVANHGAKESQPKPAPSRTTPPVAERVERPPLRQVEKRPWEFVALAVTAGVAVGFASRYKFARKALSFALRRGISLPIANTSRGVGKRAGKSPAPKNPTEAGFVTKK